MIGRSLDRRFGENVRDKLVIIGPEQGHVDTDAAFELAAEFDLPAVAIIKHANPCGVAVAENCFEAYKRALACDPVSAFGGIIALNRPLDAKTAAGP